MAGEHPGENATGFLGLASEPGYERRMDAGVPSASVRLGSVSGLSQEQLASLYTQQNRVEGAYSGTPQMFNGDIPVAPVRRIVDRVGGEANSGNSKQYVMQLPSAPAAGQYAVRPEVPYFQQPMGERFPAEAVSSMGFPAETVSTMVGVQATEYVSAETMSAYGVVPCDVLPRKAASVHDVWSGSNFCEEVAEMLQAHGCTKYFTKGVQPPKMHEFNRRGQPERDMEKMAGIGIALERIELSGAVHVKRIAGDGGAAADGRLRIGDAILAVDGMPTTGIGQELTNLIIGPEGTFVELVVERKTGEQEAILIRRGAPKPIDDSLSHNLPYASYKSYKEVPYYLSATDRENATIEVSGRIAEMRRRILEKPDTPSSSILSMELLDHTADARATFGVSRRDQQAAASNAPAPNTSPFNVLAPGISGAAGSPSVQHDFSPKVVQAIPAAADGGAGAKIEEYEKAIQEAEAPGSTVSNGGKAKKKKR